MYEMSYIRNMKSVYHRSIFTNRHLDEIKELCEVYNNLSEWNIGMNELKMNRSVQWR